MNIVYTKLAQSDLHNLVDFISLTSTASALKMLERIEDSKFLLSEHPEMGRPGRVPETREFVVPDSPYIAPYKVAGESLVILRVYHTSRKWPESF